MQIMHIHNISLTILADEVCKFINYRKCSDKCKCHTLQTYFELY